LRLFVAVPVSEETRAAAAEVRRRLEAADAQASRGVKWVPAANMHLTLKFIGEFPAARVPSVLEPLAEVAAVHAPFRVVLSGVGTFPRGQRPRVIWIGAGEGEKNLVALAENVDRALVRAGVAAETRPFAAHLTVGRLREERDGGTVVSAAFLRALRDMAVLHGGTSTIGRMTLFESTLGPGNPVYRAVETFELGGGRAPENRTP